MLKIGRRDTGRLLLIKSLLPFLCTGLLPLFQLLGKCPVSNENWKILKRGLTKDSSQILTINTLTLSHPWAFLTSKARIIERTFAGSRFTSQINKHKHTAIELNSKCTLFKSWNSLLNNNGLNYSLISWFFSCLKT